LAQYQEYAIAAGVNPQGIIFFIPASFLSFDICRCNLGLEWRGVDDGCVEKNVPECLQGRCESGDSYCKLFNNACTAGDTCEPEEILSADDGSCIDLSTCDDMDETNPSYIITDTGMGKAPRYVCKKIPESDVCTLPEKYSFIHEKCMEKNPYIGLNILRNLRNLE
jgi:hypothetical protein